VNFIARKFPTFHPLVREDAPLLEPAGGGAPRFHLRTLIICKLGFNQNYCTFTLILLIEIELGLDAIDVPPPPSSHPLVQADAPLLGPADGSAPRFHLQMLVIYKLDFLVRITARLL